MIRKEFTGMLPAAIEKFQKLLATASNLSPVVEKGYDADARIQKGKGKDSFFAWGCACRITVLDMAALKTKAEALGITWLSDDGDMAYTDSRTIIDFKTFRVGGNLKMMAKEELNLKKERTYGKL